MDVSTPRVDLGKPYGAISLPMGFSKRGEPASTSILRVMQQEVFSNQTVCQNFPFNVIPSNPQPFMYLYIADVRVAVYRIEMPKEYSDLSLFSSFKMTGFKFIEAEDLANCTLADSQVRMGLADIAKGYLNHSINEISYKPYPVSLVESELNRGLAALALDYGD
jgi:hypothetical protein